MITKTRPNHAFPARRPSNGFDRSERCILFGRRNMMVLRVHGDDLMFGSGGGVITHSPRIPQMEMMKVHIPFTFKLHESFKSTYAGKSAALTPLVHSAMRRRRPDPPRPALAGSTARRGPLIYNCLLSTACRKISSPLCNRFLISYFSVFLMLRELIFHVLRKRGRREGDRCR